VRSYGHMPAPRNNIGRYPSLSERVKAAPTEGPVSHTIVHVGGVFLLLSEGCVR
jgi:hypothetical protein